MIRAHVLSVWLACSVLLLAGPEAWAGPATDHLKTAIDRVVAALEDAALKQPGKAQARREQVRKVANDFLDFPEMGRRSLGRHWQPLTAREREEFTALFADLVERSYIAKIELYGGEKITFVDEKVEGDLASVSTKVMTQNGTEVPIDYRLSRRSQRWLVYDINIEGVSLVSNYRTQFNKIIVTSSFAELMKRMRAKRDEVSAVDEKPGRPPKN